MSIELAEAIARRSVEGSVPWEAIDRLTQLHLTTQAAAFLKDALPVLEAHGWTKGVTA